MSRQAIFHAANRFTRTHAPWSWNAREPWSDWDVYEQLHVIEHSMQRLGQRPTVPGDAKSCLNVQTQLMHYATRVEDLRTPSEVLDDLSAITTRSLPLSVLGAVRLPLKSGDWSHSARAHQHSRTKTSPKDSVRNTISSREGNSVRCLPWPSSA
jgi:hypothetical protein